MKRSLFQAALLIGGLALVASCSDDTKVVKKDTGTKKDGIQIVDQPIYPDTGTTDTGGGKKDVGGKKDTGTTKKDTGTTKKDTGTTKQDTGGTGTCDPTCTAQRRDYCVKDGTDCVECLVDGDCKANPLGMGNKCDSYGYCECATNADCTGNANGTKCDTAAQVPMCLCTADADCTVAPYTKCDVLGGFAGWCVKPCTADTDCTSKSRPTCNTTLGLCVQCKADTDCKNPNRPMCNAIGVCNDCKVDGDCTNSAYGSKCDNLNGCSCLANTDCASPFAISANCDTDYNACYCTSNTHCTAGNRGATCSTSTGMCGGCTADTDCTKNGFTKCSQMDGTATTKWCTKPCTADGDCTSQLWFSLNKCDTTTSTCVGCKATADCSKMFFGNVCNTANSTCVECVANTDCTTSSFGKTCDTANGNICTCAADTDCTGNLNGLVCDSYDSVCTCTDQSTGDPVDTNCVTGRKCTGTYPLDPTYVAACKP
jgi:hypothetical protein